MFMRLNASIFVLLGMILPGQAQETAPVAESASHELIMDALEALNIRALRQQENYSFNLKNRSVTLMRLNNGSRLLMKAMIPGRPSLETLNRYNERIAVTTRAVRYDKLGAVLEAGVDCQLGISQMGLRKFLARFSDDLAVCDDFIAKQAPREGKEEPRKEGTVEVKAGKRKVPLAITPESDDREFIITFPTGVEPEKAETAWKIIWDMESAKQANEQQFKFPKGREGSLVLFKIKKAFFKPGAKADWLQVLEDAHPAEFYVPYYFVGTRFYDLKNVGGYVSLAAKEGGLVSQTLGKSRRVMAELRDRGVTYKHGNWTRRGEELTLWANFAAGNYTYLVEYGFHDDGTIVFRHAPTGWNYYNHFNASHMHGSYWRIGIKLGPEGNNDKNQVYAVRLPTSPKEQGDTKGKLAIDEITQESYLDWNPQEFTRIRVTNPQYTVIPEAKDRPFLPIGYDLVTLVQGVARHARFKDEKFTHHDFWITRHDCPEKMYVNLGDYFETAQGELNPNLLPLNQQNVVLWHSSSGLHTPRTEDGIIGGAGMNNGQAIVYWTSFELRPRNLFLRTPIYRQLP